MRTSWAATSTAVASLVLTGCADGAEVVDDEPAEVTAATVVVDEFAFQDPSTIVAPDAEVTWDNQDDVAHTVTAGTPNDASGDFDEDLPSGGEATISFDEVGTYAYFCRIHPDMTAEVVVEAAVE